MYRTIVQTKQFKKDLQKVNFKDFTFTRFVNFLSMLSRYEQLPDEARDHQLKGILSDYREFHLSGDLLIIYRITQDNTVELIRIGSHSQLF